MEAVQGEMVSKERRPSVIGIRRSSRRVPGNGCLTDIEAEFQELAMDPWLTPQGVLRAHLSNEGPTSLGAFGRPPRRRDFQRQ